MCLCFLPLISKVDWLLKNIPSPCARLDSCKLFSIPYWPPLFFFLYCVSIWFSEIIAACFTVFMTWMPSPLSKFFFWFFFLASSPLPLMSRNLFLKTCLTFLFHYIECSDSVLAKVLTFMLIIPYLRNVIIKKKWTLQYLGRWKNKTEIWFALLVCYVKISSFIGFLLHSDVTRFFFGCVRQYDGQINRLQRKYWTHQSGTYLMSASGKSQPGQRVSTLKQIMGVCEQDWVSKGKEDQTKLL